MKEKFFGNDTIIIIFVGIAVLFSLYKGENDIANIGIGAMAGFVGSKVMIE